MFQASEDRQAAFDFLSSLEEYLNRCLPGPAQLVEQIRTIVEESKRTGQTPQTNFPEGAFLNRFIVPHLHEFLAKRLDRKSTRLNSSHSQISYAVFCLKKKKKEVKKTSHKTIVTTINLAGIRTTYTY